MSISYLSIRPSIPLSPQCVLLNAHKIGDIVPSVVLVHMTRPINRGLRDRRPTRDGTRVVIVLAAYVCTLVLPTLFHLSP